MRASRVWLVLAVAALPALAGERIRLAEFPALSPDGSRLAFSWRGDLWLAPATGGDARRLTSHAAVDREPVFSPDGRRLAFRSDRTGAPQAFVLDLAGGAPEQITFHTEGATPLDWFPDGDALLVRGPRDHHWRAANRFFLKRLDTGRSPVLLFNAAGSGGRVSPDGRHLAFVRGGSRWWRRGYTGAMAAQLWLYDTASTRFRRLSSGEHEERWPLWHPDGRRLFFVSQKDGTFNLWQRDLETGADEQLTRFSGDGVHYPTLSRDGGTIVFRRLFDLWRLDLRAGGEPRPVPLAARGDAIHEPVLRRTLTRASQAAFSDDGREIAFVAAGDLWVMDTELREPRRVTATPEEERDPVFSPDFQTLLFVSDRGGQPDLWRARRADESAPWWLNHEFVVERVTDDPQPERRPRFLADGRVAFTNLRGDLWTMQADGSDLRLLLESWNEPTWSFSPDGRWVAYAVEDDDFNRDVWIRPADGGGAPVNVSRHPDNETGPVWSPDGRMLAFVGERAHDETDVHFVWLRKPDEDATKRDRTLKKALEKMEEREKERKKKGEKKNGREKEKEKDQPRVEVVIDFDGISERIHRVAIPNVGEAGLFWSPDSKRIAFRAEIDGKAGLYTVAPPDELEPKLLTAPAGTGARWLADGTIVWLDPSGRPAAVDGRGKATRFPFRVRHDVDLRQRHRAAFDQAWRTMRDHFYDERLNGRDWNAVRAKYREMAGGCVTLRELSLVVSLMLGELNGSHLGFWPRERDDWKPRGWREETVHFGVRFDARWVGPGLRVAEVLPKSPAARADSRLRPGELVLAVDGRTVAPAEHPARALTGRLDRDYRLRVRATNGQERTVVLRPTSYAAARQQLYERWVEANRARVAEWSDGRLGYLHVRGMNWRSFERFEAELYKVGHGRAGLVIDVRDNGGGWTTDHLLTCLTQPRHAITVARGGGKGYPQDRLVYARWNRPVVVLCNQNSFSNAEIFCHAIKTLGRGRIVGVPTAGGVISTGGTAIMDFAFLRLPFRGWFTIGDGEDMELRGCVPDVVLWPEPGEIPAGRDRQLETAVAMLVEDVARAAARPRARPRYRSER